MRKRWVVGAFMLAFLMMAMPIEKAQAASWVQVRVPTFPVKLNGVSIQNAYDRYPLIVHKGITYFPMTYYGSRFMGLETLWNSKQGLSIEQNKGRGEYKNDPSPTRNGSAYRAQVASFGVYVNQKPIDNEREAYPLLVFRNVTYFPLTWRFAVDAFGWNYAFDPVEGLAIESSPGLRVKDVTLPIAKRDYEPEGAFTKAGDFYYYEGEQGKIYRAPLSNPAQAREVFQMPAAGYGDAPYAFPRLFTEQNQAMLGYHTGGAVMGTDHLLQLFPDKKPVRVVESGYKLVKNFEGDQVSVDQFFPPIPNNLFIKRKGEKAPHRIGDPSLIYGIALQREANGQAGSPSKDLYRRQNKIYVLGYTGKEGDTTGIYQVDSDSQETRRLFTQEAAKFTWVGEQILFKDFQGYLYQGPFTGGQAQRLVNQPVALYEEFEDKIYYSLSADQQMRQIGKAGLINPGAKLQRFQIEGKYLIAFFDAGTTSAYRMLVLDPAGKILYTSKEKINWAFFQDDQLVLVKDR